MTGAGRWSSRSATGWSPATRDDESGERLATRLAELGFAIDRARVPDEGWQIEQALVEGAAGHALIVTTGGTGLTPRDVTPAGDGRGRRLRGPRPGRGHPRRGSPVDPDGRPVARRRRRPVGLARGQRARAARAGRSSRSRRSCRSSATPSRRSRGRSTTSPRPRPEIARTCRPAGDAASVRDVRGGSRLPARLPAVLGRGRRLRAGHGPPPADLRRRPGRRPEPARRRPAPDGGSSSDTPSSRRRCSRTAGPALMHLGIFWGFVLLTIGTANIVTGGLVQAIISWPLDGVLWTAVVGDAERRRRDRRSWRSATRSSGGS